MKVCTKCKEEKDDLMFYNNFKRCKDCVRDYQRQKGRIHRKSVYEQLEYVRGLRSKECLESLERLRRVRKNQSTKVYNHTRRIKLENSPFPPDFKLMSHCWVCLSTENLQVDHILPVSRGGDNSIENLTTLCKHCNTSKGSKTYSEWFEQRLQRARSEM